MTSENFAYWLQGFLEISEKTELNEKELAIIKDHLALVFNKVTPNRQFGSLGAPRTTLEYINPDFNRTNVFCTSINPDVPLFTGINDSNYIQGDGVANVFNFNKDIDGFKKPCVSC